MKPTLLDQEQILGEKLSLNLMEPKRGEIFIFKHPQNGKLLIKRLIALPNEKLTIKEGKVYIDRKLLTENYLEDVYTNAGKYIMEDTEVIVPEGQYLFMGDNREQSLDGRDWGFVHKENIESRALLVYFPVSNFRLVNKLSK